jgi:hypothetical protein
LSYAGLSPGLVHAAGVDVFSTNQQYIRTVMLHASLPVMRWVRETTGDYYALYNPNNGWQDATISNNLRYLDVWYHLPTYVRWRRRSISARWRSHNT